MNEEDEERDFSLAKEIPLPYPPFKADWVSKWIPDLKSQFHMVRVSSDNQ